MALPHSSAKGDHAPTDFLCRRTAGTVRTPRKPPVIRFLVVVALFSASGIAALLYQFVWIRQLSHLLGGTSLAISSVLAVFMGGLAAGSRFFGDRADRTSNPLRLYAFLEVGIGVAGALVPLAILAAEPLYVGAAHALPRPLWPLLRILLAAVLLLVPTFLMGGTLPVLSRFVVRRADRIGRGLGLLYAANTAGAVLGAFLAGFVLVEALGLYRCTAVAVGLNLAIALVVLALAGGARRGAAADAVAAGEAAGPADGNPAAPQAKGASRVKPELDARLLAIVFALSGFASLGYEIHWTRALQHFLGNSTYAYSAMLTTFLLGLSAGGWAGGVIADRARHPAAWLGWVQLSIGATVALTVPLIWSGLPRIAGEAFLTPANVAWHTYLIRRFLVAFLVMAPPTLLIGMTFPLVNRIGIHGLTRLGHGVGFLYFANTCGAILGSLAAGFVILPALGPKGGILAIAALSALIGATVHAARDGGGRGSRIAGAATAAAVLLAAFPFARLTGGMLADGQAPGDRVLFDAEDPIASVRVYEKPNGDREVAVDGHRIGGSAAGMQRKEKVLAHLPFVMVPQAPNVLAVGLGSGITLGSLALHDEVRSLTCIEIVPSVPEATDFFRAEHHDVLDDPRVRVVIEDGVQFLLTTTDRYDIISSDSKINPHYVGNAPLLARDYYELCRGRLTDDGVMVQWLPLHLPESIMRMVTRSFAEAFPHCALFWHYPYNLIQIGSRAPIEADLDRARRLAADPRVGGEMEFLQLENPEALASLFVAVDGDVRAAVGAGDINTWARPRLEFRVIREHLQRPTAAHEDANLRWLFRSRKGEPPRLRGEYDRGLLARFEVSSGKLLQGYAAGGGIAELRTGRLAFEEGLQANPDDWRLRHILTVLEGKGGR